MRQLFQNVAADPCSFCCLAVMLWAIGKMAVEGWDRLRKFGAALAGAALLIAFAYGMSWGLYVLDNCIFALSVALFCLGGFWAVLVIIAYGLTFLRDCWRMRPKPKRSPTAPVVFHFPAPVQPPEPVKLPPPPEPTVEEQVKRSEKMLEEELRIAESFAEEMRESARAAARNRHAERLLAIQQKVQEGASP